MYKRQGINLVTVLPEPLTSPILTAEWEQKLTEIAKGNADPDTFMGGIRTMVQEIVSTYSCISEDGKKLFAPEKEVIRKVTRIADTGSLGILRHCLGVVHIADIGTLITTGSKVHTCLLYTSRFSIRGTALPIKSSVREKWLSFLSGRG